MSKTKSGKIGSWSLKRQLVKFTPLLVAVALLTSVGVYAQHSRVTTPSRPVITTKVTKQTPAADKKVTHKKPAQPPATVPAPTPKQQRPATHSSISSPTTVAASHASPGKKVSSLSSAPAPIQKTAPAPTSSPTPDDSSAPTSSTPSASSLPPATAAYTSTNWAGYFMMAHSYTKVSGSWTATSPTGNNTDTTADATWIGIGGVSSQDLIQVGTENTIASSGQVSTAVFYELLPDIPVYPRGIPVLPGDKMAASVSETSANQWSINITDVTTGKTFATTVSYTSSHSSAEWIQEDPSYASGGLVPFDYFGIASFTDSSAVYGSTTVSLSSPSAYAIQMVDMVNKPVATPSIIGSDGASFNVVRN